MTKEMKVSRILHNCRNASNPHDNIIQPEHNEREQEIIDQALSQLKALIKKEMPKKKKIPKNPEETYYGWKYELGFNQAIGQMEECIEILFK